MPQTRFGGPCKAIRLRPDRDFRRRTLTGPWVVWAAILGFGALFVGALGLFVNLLFVPAAAVFAAAMVVAGLGFWLTRWPADETRHRGIRLLLGRHEWGGSDPATWSEELVAEVVNPKAEFGVESYAALAVQERKAGRLGKAMWAARLCAAIEDEAQGEELTDAILTEAEEAGQLRRVRRRPGDRDKEFGPAPGLEKWVNCDPVEHILLIE
jgi:hypothetical protein